ncbi:MAG: 16S rRNA (adenine(1518)-N(6)/adenine(1519)-N(6))-dimethyltransferase RsmA [Clostridiales bacterium]|nr:16S rRNA (adenine(1518)-N(6)/adenine(1519)-N(6))-dimethyltransferase RsmA [Clostridiales bacterium]
MTNCGKQAAEPLCTVIATIHRSNGGAVIKFSEKRIITREGARSVLAHYGLHTRKKLGQHYLVDSHVLEKTLRAADVTENDCVLEIGPGLGAVTQALAERAGHVAAVELDAQTVEALRDMYRDAENVHIIHGDILKLDLFELFSPYGGAPLKVVANLPYYITTPVLMRLLEDGPRFDRITVMIQREVAERMCAKPSTKDYGALTLAAQYHAEIEIAAYVPPNSFIPRPNVDSAVVCLKPWETPPVAADKENLFRVIRAAFNQRRKTLVNALCAYAGYNREHFQNITKEAVAEALVNIGLPADIRGEAMDLTQFAAIAEMLKGN